MDVAELREITNITAAKKWLAVDASPGDAVIYHVGCLSIDREPKNSNSIAVGRLAGFMLEAFENRAVHLVQKKEWEAKDRHCWLYIAIRRPNYKYSAEFVAKTAKEARVLTEH